MVAPAVIRRFLGDYSEGSDGFFVVQEEEIVLTTNGIDFNRIIKYMKTNSKGFQALTPEEIKMFKFRE